METALANISKKGKKIASKKNADKVAKIAKQTASYANDNTKTVLILGALFAGGYVLYKIAKNTGEAVESIFSIFSSDPLAGGGNLNILPKYNVIPEGGSITLNSAQIKAAAIKTGFDYWAGTDLDTIYNNLKGMNPIDFSAISTAFRKPKYFIGASGGAVGTPLDLVSWIYEELTSNEIAHLKTIMPGVL